MRTWLPNETEATPLRFHIDTLSLKEIFMATLHDNDNTLLALVRTTFDAHSAVLFLPDQSAQLYGRAFLHGQ